MGSNVPVTRRVGPLLRVQIPPGTTEEIGRRTDPTPLRRLRSFDGPHASHVSRSDKPNTYTVGMEHVWTLISGGFYNTETAERIEWDQDGDGSHLYYNPVTKKRPYF